MAINVIKTNDQVQMDRKKVCLFASWLAAKTADHLSFVVRKNRQQQQQNREERKKENVLPHA